MAKSDPTVARCADCGKEMDEYELTVSVGFEVEGWGSRERNVNAAHRYVNSLGMPFCLKCMSNRIAMRLKELDEQRRLAREQPDAAQRGQRRWYDPSSWFK